MDSQNALRVPSWRFAMICNTFQLIVGMRRYEALALLLLILAGLGETIASAQGQDNVTIPKSRLEELERKEKELDRLRQEGQPGGQSNAPVQLSPDHAPARPNPAGASATLAPAPSVVLQ